MDRHSAFRAYTDQMLAFIDQLRDAEERKRRVAFASPEFVQAAKETEELSRLTFRWAQMQLSMALSEASLGIDDGVELIHVQPRPLDRILAAWREAQLRLEIAPPERRKPRLPFVRSSACARSTGRDMKPDATRRRGWRTIQATDNVWR